MEAELDTRVLEAVARSRAALVVLGPDGAVLRWGDGAEALFGWSAEEVIGRHWATIGLAGDGLRRDRAARVVATLLSGGRVDGEWLARRKDGALVRVHTIHEPLRDATGKPVGIVSMSFDQSAREQLERQLLREALHDQLTGLPGRALLKSELATLLDPSAAGSGEVSLSSSPRAAVLFLDLDGFKAVNDRHGHAVGDVVLAHVAERLRAAVRAGDLVARVGGDEFVIVVPLDGSTGVVAEVEDRVVSALAEPVVLDGLGVRAEVSASIGVALAHAGADPYDIVCQADAAMYRAKRAVRV